MGLAENFQEKWESFLQWSDEKGMPFRGISDSLEEKGIPAMPFFMFLIFLIIAGLLYSLFSQQAIGLISPSTTAITLTLTDSSGNPVPNADVSLVSKSSDGATLSGSTDKSGVASFSDVKISSSFIVSAVDDSGNTLKFEDDSIDIIKNKEEYFASLASELISPKASLTVEITGGPEDSKKITTVVADDAGFPAQAAQVGNKPIFIGLDLNREYLLKVDSTGFRTENRKITLTSDQIVSVALKENSVANKGKLKITVLDIETGKPLKGASVSVIDSETGVIHFKN
ncbi:MAG: Ig-like domain-containing protein, partial [Candidatus Micrarchaeota archaeon]